MDPQNQPQSSQVSLGTSTPTTANTSTSTSTTQSSLNDIASRSRPYISGTARYLKESHMKEGTVYGRIYRHDQLYPPGTQGVPARGLVYMGKASGAIAGFDKRFYGSGSQ